MKTRIWKILAIALTISISGCDSILKDDEEANSSAGGASSTPTQTAPIPTAIPAQGTVSCNGDVSDGYAETRQVGQLNQNPLIIYPLEMAGRQSWRPGGRPNVAEDGDSGFNHVPSLNEFYAATENDGAIYIRFRVNAQPTYSQEAGCYGRKIGPPSFDNYKKLSFRVNAYPMTQTGSNAQINFGVKKTVYSSVAVNVDQCTDLIQIPSFGTGAVAIEVEEVSSDQFCRQGYTELCPAKRAVREYDCWSLTLQIATNKTHFFKGYNRSDL